MIREARRSSDMIKMRALVTSMLVALVLTVSLAGHHSFAAFYFEDQMIEFEGDITEVQFKSPHTWIYVSSQDEAGKARTYAAEWANPSRLERDGMTKDTLKVGDVVRIWASPSRDASDNKVHLKRILRPSDGWQWNPPRRGAR
jgi:Family of unknown function (DUF6152)